MKKITVLLVIVAFITVLVSSCKTADCPAYSKVNKAKTEQQKI